MENLVLVNNTIVKYICKPLTPETWHDFEDLFGKNGACAGCWCMYFRGNRKEWEKDRGEGNHLRLKEIVDAGTPTGLLAYVGEIVVGWCAVAPRSDYEALERSRYYKAIDDRLVWSITCFFTRKGYRRKGITRFLINSAIEYGRSQKIDALEAYPIVPKKAIVPDVYAYTGFYQVFLDSGFTVAARRNEFNPILRYNY